ncbi:MAG: tRNA epoxyqueuosine(34) reductase QueG [Myxococcales bacterium]|nr:tRNA epoxyqueuosine(34) reductase QueG [Myxococcales bacterium]MCB9580874.1 tRNA epoxyqueuosine(34) reductase QueG [Polyangiaceae bacterium]
MFQPSTAPSFDPRSGAEKADDPAAAIGSAARSLGFARVGFARAERWNDAAERLEAWLAHGHHGGMQYLATQGDRADPRALFPDAQTVIAVALPHGAGAVPLRTGPTGRIARYARGADYHDVIRDKLRQLAQHAADAVGRPVRARVCVDTAPLLEREAAARAGLGFIAKSTLLLAPGLGTYFLLGALLVDVELPSSAPVAPGCGSCRACLDACPTNAFVNAHVLDARRCISYLTIEQPGAIPRELRSAIGTRVFGCDVCQEVCPHNQSPTPRPVAPELAASPERQDLDLVALLELSSSAYRRLVAGSALRRVHRAQLQRNAAVALGNAGDPRATEPLARALESSRYPLVRAHAAWALGALGSGREALERAAESDPDPSVREEAKSALGLTEAPPPL